MRPVKSLIRLVRFLTLRSIYCIFPAGIASVTAIWHVESRPYIHALQVMLSTGGVIAPIIIEPFLAPRNRDHRTLHNTTDDFFTNISSYNAINESVFLSNISDAFNKSNLVTKVTNFKTSESVNTTDYDLYQNINPCLLQLPYLGSSYSNWTLLCNQETASVENKTVESFVVDIGETRIHYAFIIFALFGILASVTVFLFIIIDCQYKEVEHISKSNKENVITKRIKYSLPNKLQHLLLSIVTVKFYLVSAMCFKCYAFLPSFYVLQFDWSTSLATLAMSVFWIGRTVAGVVGIFLAAQFKQSVLIPCFSLIYIMSTVCLIISGFNNYTELAWTSTGLLGIGLSILFPSLFALTEENIRHVTGRIASLYMFSLMTGSMLDPLYTSFLMDNVSPMWFVYLLFIQSVLFLLLFILVKTLLWRYSQRQDTGQETGTEEMKAFPVSQYN